MRVPAEGPAGRAEASTARSPTLSGAVCPDPVFIIGCPRSGTSILAWSLAQHGDLWTSAETDFLLHLFGPPANDLFGRSRLDVALDTIYSRAGGSWPEEFGIARSAFAAHVALGLNKLITEQAGGKRWIEQSPTYTVMVDALAEMFPGAYFLHILRDGRHVVNSMINSGFGTYWANDFRQACATWARFTQAAMRFQRANPARCLTVFHEQLVRHPDETFPEILRFVRASPDVAPATFFKANRINSSYHPQSQRSPRRRSPEEPGGEPTSVPYQGPPDPWDGWDSERRMTFLEVAGDPLVQYGYAGEGELRP